MTPRPGGNPNEGIDHNNGDYLTARVLASSSVGSFSPEEIKVKEMLQASASAKHKLFGDMIKVKHDVESKRHMLVAL
jgi:hypothetical protein